MTLPTSGPLSLSDIQTEFGGSNPISLDEYYAGGSYVPAGTTGTNGAVPSSGTISINNFYGTTSALETHTMTIGLSGSVWGFQTGSFGALSPTTSSIYGGATVNRISATAISDQTFFGINGVVSNSGWSTIIINGTSFSRTAASFSTAGGISIWTWTDTFPTTPSPCTVSILA